MALPTPVTQLSTIVKPSLPTVNPTENMLKMPSDTIILCPSLQSSSKNALDPHCPLTVKGRLQYLAAPQTWAECNPAAPMEPPSCPSVKLSEAVKATKKFTYKANKKAAAFLDANIKKLRTWQDVEIMNIAKKHSKKVAEIETTASATNLQGIWTWQMHSLICNPRKWMKVCTIHPELGHQ